MVPAECGDAAGCPSSAGCDYDAAWNICRLSLDDVLQLAMNLVPSHIPQQFVLLLQALGGDQSWLGLAFQEAVAPDRHANFCQLIGSALHLLRGHMLWVTPGSPEGTSLAAVMDGMSVQLCKGATPQVLSLLADHVAQINAGQHGAATGQMLGGMLSILRQMTSGSKAGALACGHPLLAAPPELIEALGAAMHQPNNVQSQEHILHILGVWLHTAQAAAAGGVPVPHPEHMVPAVCKLLMSRWVLSRSAAPVNFQHVQAGCCACALMHHS